MEWLLKIQRKPERERRTIAIVASGLLTFFFFVVYWFWPVKQAQVETQSTASIVEIVSPLTQMKEAIGNFWDNASNQIGTIKEKVGF